MTGSLPRSLSRSVILLLAAAFAIGGCDAILGVDRYVRDGQALLARADYDAAGARFKRALEAEPDRIDARIGLAESELGAGDLESARKELERAAILNADPVLTEPLRWRVELALGRYAAVAGALARPRRGLDEMQRELFLAEALVNLGRIDEAEPLYRALLASNPRSVPVLTAYGFALERSGHADAALQMINAALAVHPDDADALLLRAGVLRADGRREDALAAYDYARAHIDSHRNRALFVQAATGVAELAIEADDWRKARTAVLELTQLVPSAVDTQLLAARVAIADGSAAAALDSLQALASAFPDDLRVVRLRGTAEIATGALGQAESSLGRVLRAQPDDASLRGELADLQVREQRFVAAQATLEGAPGGVIDVVRLAGVGRAMQQHGDAAGARALATRLQRNVGTRVEGVLLEGDLATADRDFAGAVRVYDRALALRPEGRIAARRYAAAQAGATPGAMAWLAGWVRAHPRDAEGHVALAGALRAAGNLAGAAGEYEAAVDADPSAAVAMNNLALVYDEMGDARALALAQRAHALRGTIPAITDTLGWLLIRHGDAAEGTRLLAGIATPGADPEIRYHYAAGLAKVGRKPEASHILITVLSSGASFPSRAAAAELAKQVAP